MDNHADNEWKAFLKKRHELLDIKLCEQDKYLGSSTHINKLFEVAKECIAIMYDQWLIISNKSWLRELPKKKQIKNLTSKEINLFESFLEEEKVYISDKIFASIKDTNRTANKTSFNKNKESFNDHCNVLLERFKSNIETRSSERYTQLKKEISDNYNKKIPIFISFGVLIVSICTFGYNCHNSLNNSDDIKKISEKISNIDERLKKIEANFKTKKVMPLRVK